MAEGLRLGVGFIGSGFITRFHIRSWVGARDSDVRGVWSPNPGRAEEAAAVARSLRVGEAKAFPSIEAMVAAPEKPVARKAAEARRMVELVTKAGVLHGYLEDQLFSPGPERVVEFPPPGVESFVPAVARGTWKA